MNFFFYLLFLFLLELISNLILFFNIRIIGIYSVKENLLIAGTLTIFYLFFILLGLRLDSILYLIQLVQKILFETPRNC